MKAPKHKRSLTKKILGVIALGIAALCGYVALQPSRYEIARAMEMRATPNQIFPHLNNQHLATVWMPWKALDPQMVMTFSGPEAGVGARSSWESPGEMGVGQAEIVESAVNQHVKTKLTYQKPMEMNQLATIALEPRGEITIVRWSVVGENNFIGRLFCLLLSVEDMVGKNFTTGLTTLKNIVETANQ